MSLNKFMHPRNRYKFKRPDFEVLGKKYPEFQQHLVTNEKGKPALDFQNPEALRVLTTCLLQEDYGLKVELPPDRLVPTLPLRLNYVHWLEDITQDWGKQELSAIDIGTGACCIYPVLAVSANPWRFLTTEADEVNFSYAVKNMQENNLSERIKVMKVAPDTILEGVIGTTEDMYDFCMCNPPFFADHLEAQGLVSRSPSRPDPKTMSTASPQESIVQGGEIAFVKKMIEESNYLQKRVRVYSTMLGKKASLAPLKEVLRRLKITNFASTEFCQGKTMRWGLAWSFDPSVNFPKSEFSQGKKEGKKSVVHIIPTAMGERREDVYSLVAFFKQIFSELKIHYRDGKQSKFFALLTLTAAENTWVHARRKRRQMMREAAEAKSSCTTETSAQPAATDTAAASSSDTAAASSSSLPPASQCGGQADSTTVSTGSETGAADVTVTPSSGNAGETDLQECMNTDKVISSSQCGTEVESGKRKAETDADTGEAVANPPGKRIKLDPQTPPSSNAKESDSNIVDSTEKSSQPMDEEKSKPSAKCTNGDSQTLTSVNAEVDANTKETAENPSQPKEEGTNPPATTPASGEGEEGEVRGKDRPPAQYVLKCHMSVRVQGSDLAVELTWLGGQDIQLMHQIMQLFKNRLTQRKST